MSVLHTFPRALLVALVTFAATASAQVYPLSENTWSNPDFVKRFMGSYGVLTEREPQVTKEEADFFQNQLQPLLQVNNYSAAASLLQQRITPESSAALDYTLGNLFLQQQRNRDAIPAYERAVKKFPNFLRAYRNLGLARVQEGDYALARDLFIKALELGDASGNTYGLVAFCYLNLEQHAAARDAYALARVLDPKNRDWTVGFGQALIQTQEFRKAIGVFQELITKEPGRTSYYTQIANAYIALEEFGPASRYLEVIRRLGDANASTLLLLGDLYINDGLIALALDAYQSADTAPGEVSEERALRVISAFLRRSAYPEAAQYIDAFEARLGSSMETSTEIALLNFKAEIAMAEGRQADAITTLEEVTELDPFNGRALILIGNYYAEQGDDPAKAIYYYELAQNVRKAAVEASIQHARLRVRRKEYTEAIALLENAQGIEYQANVARYLDAVRRVMDAAR